MADAPADPQLFYERHIFMCNNVRPEGHPRGCCMARAEAAGGFDKLRGYAREKARQLGIENVRFNAAGLPRPLRVRPQHGDLSRGRLVPLRDDQQDIDEILENHLMSGGRVERLMLQPDQLPPKH